MKSVILDIFWLTLDNAVSNDIASIFSKTVLILFSQLHQIHHLVLIPIGYGSY